MVQADLREVIEPDGDYNMTQGLGCSLMEPLPAHGRRGRSLIAGTGGLAHSL